MASLIYRSPLVYQLVMRLLHGRHYSDRYRVLADEVPAGAEVVELCAGDARLYRYFLQPKGVKYLGLDNSPHFVSAARSHGLNFRLFDASKEEIPPADVILIQASLHLFHPQIEAFISRMLDAARQHVLISEPVRNLSSSSNPVVAWVGKTFTRPHGPGLDHTHRFTETTFTQLMETFPECTRIFFEPGKREMISVLKGRNTAT